MTEHDSDRLVLREAMAFSGGAQPLDPSDVICRARRRRSRNRATVVVGAVAMVAAVGVGATAVTDPLRESATPTISEAPDPVETVDAVDAVANLGHGWSLTTRTDKVCLHLDDRDEGCFIGNDEVEGGDYFNGGGVAGWQEPETARAPAMLAWLVPAETSTAVVTAEGGLRLPADVYALTDVPGARLAVVFVEDETRFWQRVDRRVKSSDSTGAVIADWPVRYLESFARAREARGAS